MNVAVQNRSVLSNQDEQEPIPVGVYDAELVEVTNFANVFGPRVGLRFRITSGPHEGVEVMDSAAAGGSPRGKLAELLRGLGGAAGDLQGRVGRRCRIAVGHESNKAGKRYASITHTFS